MRSARVTIRPQALTDSPQLPAVAAARADICDTSVEPRRCHVLSKRAFLRAGIGIGATVSAVFAGRYVAALANVQTPSPYPTGPVRWVVPYTSGGATDVMSRLVCARLSDRLGQPFVVENKPGAGSSIGTESVINSPADGHTLLLTSTANAINASFDRKLKFDFLKGIVPVAGLARIPLVLVVNNDIPAHTLAEFIDYARAHSGELSTASSGIGTSLHLSGELFGAMIGARLIHVPYKGSAPALTDVMSGQVQLMFDNVTSSLELIRAGKVRALGVTTSERSAALPDVPSISETLPGYETSSFYGVGAPRATPREIVQLLNLEINAAVAEGSVRTTLDELGANAIMGDTEQFNAMYVAETERWRRIVALAVPPTN
jgi:tripartite-type tricarboxylate transporter receptor subunit TctC